MTILDLLFIPVTVIYFLVVTNRGMVAEVFRDEVAGEWFVGRRLD